MPIEELLVVNSVLLAILLGRTFLGPYIGEKGKNLATKEDIADITNQIEAVKAQFSRAGHVQNVQFEAELKAYTEIWSKIVDLQRVGEQMRHVLAIADHRREEKALTDVYDSFNDALDAFSVTVQRGRPFYAALVLQALVDLNERLADVARDYLSDAKTSLRESHAELLEGADRICAAIRARMDQLCAV